MRGFIYESLKIKIIKAVRSLVKLDKFILRWICKQRIDASVVTLARPFELYSHMLAQFKAKRGQHSILEKQHNDEITDLIVHRVYKFLEVVCI